MERGEPMPLSTKRALSRSLKRQLSTRTLDKITVKDIVEDCGVNRQTFYYYFRDIYDLLEWNFQDEAENLIRASENQTDWRAGLKTVMEYLKENRTLIWNAYHSISHGTVSDFLKRTLQPFVLRTVQKKAESLEEPPCREDIDFVAENCTQMAIGFITEWINHQETEGMEDRLQKLITAMDGSACLMLRNLTYGKEKGYSKNDERTL